MKLIKLDAIDSTNDYLKLLSNEKTVDNFTVIYSKNQTNGKGQMGNIWKSESGKNLTFSILIKNILKNSTQIFDLNVTIASSIIQVLKTLQIPELTIKWPNDILSGNKKIGGILIENSFKPDKSIESVVGIGLNVNQTDFENLPKAASLSLIMNQEFDLDIVLEKIVLKIEKNCYLISEKNTNTIWKFYSDCLFKKNIEMDFETSENKKIKGKIIGVTQLGLLEVLVYPNNIKTFSIKEIQMIY